MFKIIKLSSIAIILLIALSTPPLATSTDVHNNSPGLVMQKLKKDLPKQNDVAVLSEVQPGVMAVYNFVDNVVVEFESPKSDIQHAILIEEKKEKKIPVKYYYTSSFERSTYNDQLTDFKLERQRWKDLHRRPSNNT